ncbi:hypothetical protein MMC18_004709 [Xylographa bjoerkii]|nr:hypothetical protein [Xylographa bjoerkii]
MRSYGRDEQGVKLTDGSGYLVRGEHYLPSNQATSTDQGRKKRLFQYMNSDYYFPNISSIHDDWDMAHTYHCLDLIRQGIMCRIDVSPVTFRWGHKQAMPLANFSSSHSCYSRDAFYDWSKEHSVDAYTPGLVVHPTLGPSYPDGHGSHLGVAIDS